MGFPGVKPADASAAAGIVVEVGVVAAVLYSDVAIQIKVGHGIPIAVKRGGVGAAVHGTGSVDAVNRISEHLSRLSNGHGAAQLNARTAARQEVNHQRIVRYFVEPAGPAFLIGAQ